MPVLVAHFFLAHVAALRRDHARLGWASQRSRRACRLAPARSPAPTTPSTPRRWRATRVFARRRQQHRRLVRSRFRGGVPPCVRADDGASEPPGGGPDHLQRRGARLLRAVGCVEHRQQHDAAEEEPRSARAGARQDRPCHRPPHRLAGDDEGAAERVQQGSAGRQGSGLRRGGQRWPARWPRSSASSTDSRCFPSRRRAAASGLLLATDVADFLVGKGMPFRQAHEVVGGMVRQLVAEGRDFGR